ncbi:30S ribosomal protein S4 [Niveibacterium sp. SC-1]|uniref:30S ribosomal protein S4 n=1 Tax=Niveibacterium sp. SC-1 TaxID=3135646 RepID=UPI00311EC9E9
MARYIGPRVRILRALGTPLPGLTRKEVGNRTERPGQHGAKPNTRKSGFGLQLIEKQKLRYHYGVNETQLRNLVKEAKGGKQPTGEKLVELLERRIDNMVFRAGFAPSIPCARQLIRHGHIQLNGRRVTIPSQRLRVGDTLSLGPKAQKVPAVVESLQQPALERPEWIAFDETAKAARLSHLPGVDAQPFPLDTQKIVEYYAQRV